MNEEYITITKQEYVNLQVVEENYKYLQQKYDELLQGVRKVIEAYDETDR